MEKNFREEIRYFHGETKDGYRFTIAGIIYGNICEMGTALCSNYDYFNKATGRAIATTRLLSERNKLSIGKQVSTISEIIKDNPAKTFSQHASQYNNITKKSFEKYFNLYNHEPYIVVPF